MKRRIRGYQQPIFQPRGFTLVETCIVLFIVSSVMTFSTSHLKESYDRMIASHFFYNFERELAYRQLVAITTGNLTAVNFDQGKLYFRENTKYKVFPLPSNMKILQQNGTEMRFTPYTGNIVGMPTITFIWQEGKHEKKITYQFTFSNGNIEKQ